MNFVLRGLRMSYPWNRLRDYKWTQPFVKKGMHFICYWFSCGRSSSSLHCLREYYRTTRILQNLSIIRTPSFLFPNDPVIILHSLCVCVCVCTGKQTFTICVCVVDCCLYNSLLPIGGFPFVLWKVVPVRAVKGVVYYLFMFVSPPGVADNGDDDNDRPISSSHIIIIIIVVVVITATTAYRSSLRLFLFPRVVVVSLIRVSGYVWLIVVCIILSYKRSSCCSVVPFGILFLISLHPIGPSPFMLW